jgi:hypothetical protein
VLARPVSSNSFIRPRQRESRGVSQKILSKKPTIDVLRFQPRNAGIILR